MYQLSDYEDDSDSDYEKLFEEPETKNEIALYLIFKLFLLFLIKNINN